MIAVWLLSSLVLVPQGAAAAPTATQKERPATPVLTTTGAFFALSVPDAQASARWYQDKFGLKIVLDAPKQAASKAIVLEGGGLIVELLQRDDAMPLERAAPGRKEQYRVHGFFKAGLIVDDLDATLAALRARGVEIAIGPFPARPDQRANAIIRDNAGNLIQLFGKYR